MGGEKTVGILGDLYSRPRPAAIILRIVDLAIIGELWLLAEQSRFRTPRAPRRALELKMPS